jgi:hypothetical protein
MPEIEEQRIREAQDAAESTGDDLAERNEQLGEHIKEARSGWESAKSDDGVPTAAGDWEDSEPDDSTGEDPTGFDDPENVDADDDDLDDEELSDDEY